MPAIYADETQVLGSELPVIDRLDEYPTISLQPTSTKMRRVAWQQVADNQYRALYALEPIIKPVPGAEENVTWKEDGEDGED
ncbi:hypothetical protein M5119_11425 [Lacticaseibacillus paracasei]|uniref:hypothetical protein n=1 Tax=Lacticaseibacillus TaxID=2759736 RepID=UPI000343A39F|nr:hypothetical protein [Lacticaseibacillus paracasei]EPC27558.1 hypothetical protein Lpp46_0894 [Lacticaseibacillus paracasei subsp. paracasei Lpp46]MBU6045531.1 hypothetical protein [Lacticaseibacillus paracasei]MCL4970352.1 hypothetical protein [Lacticaseibacillus paracasei]RND58509.1 hypothetical protein FAM18123_03039 [Lacticaseibacillus paracasei]RNE47509.1 hypothetical protein FAM8407_00595 [Lacticaseibacillus paracasei]